MICIQTIFFSSLIFPAGCGEVLKARRQNRKTSNEVFVQWIPTQSVDCCSFGHVKNQCRSTPSCYRCTKDHSVDSYEVPTIWPSAYLQLAINMQEVTEIFSPTNIKAVMMLETMAIWKPHLLVHQSADDTELTKQVFAPISFPISTTLLRQPALPVPVILIPPKILSGNNHPISSPPSPHCKGL